MREFRRVDGGLEQRGAGGESETGKPVSNNTWGDPNHDPPRGGSAVPEPNKENMFLLDGPDCPFADTMAGTELERILREGDEVEVEDAHLEHEAGVDELVQSLPAQAEDAKNPKKLSEPVAAAAATQASDAAVLAATVDAGGISVCGASSSSDVPAPVFGPLSRTATIANSIGILRPVGLKDYHWIGGGGRALICPPTAPRP